MAATLIVQCRANVFSVLVDAHSKGKLEIESGQIKGVQFGVRYDRGPEHIFLATESVNHDAFFWPNAPAEIARLEKADTAVVSFTQFQAGKVNLEFNVSGFGEAQKTLRRQCAGQP